MAEKPEKVEKKCAKIVKWNADHICTFLETYINFEMLWNTRHPDYVNQTKRMSAMLKLQADLKDLGIVVPDLAFLRARIKTIKTTYRNELSKVNDSKKTGASTDEIYVPKLQWFTIADSFLRDVAITRNSKSNLDTQTTSTEENQMNETTGDAETEEGTIEEDIVVDDLPEQNKTKADAAPDFQKPMTKIRRVTKLARIESTVEKLKQITTDNRTSTTSNVSADEVDLFGKYVAAQLRELPLKNRLTCQDKIQSMLTKERLALLSSPEPPMSPASPMLSGNSSYGNLSHDDDYTSEQHQYTTDGTFLYRQLK